MRMKISKIINLCIGSIVLWVWLSMTFRLGPLGAQSEGGFQNLRYFTVLSNLLQGCVSLAYFFGKRVDRLKYASTTAMSLTFCVSHEPHLLCRPLLLRADTRLRCDVFRGQFLLPPGDTYSLHRGFFIFRPFMYIHTGRQSVYNDPACGLQSVLHGKPFHQRRRWQ